MTFQKGVSGNPSAMWPVGKSGNPHKIHAAFRREVEIHGLNALRRIVNTAMTSENEELRFRADSFLVSYAFVRPAQQVDVTAMQTV
jgi:hypothetical protein